MRVEQRDSGLIVPAEPPKPRKQSILEKHPLPWQRGGEHETMCEIVDGTGKRVCVIRPGIPFDGTQSELADFLCNMVNGFQVLTK